MYSSQSYCLSQALRRFDSFRYWKIFLCSLGPYFWANPNSGGRVFI